MHEQLTEALHKSDGVLARQVLPHLGSQIDWAIRCGELVRVLKGLYAQPSDATTLPTRMRAVSLADPRAVFCGHTAGVLHGWFAGQDDQFLDVASATLHHTDWLKVTRRSIPSRLTRKVAGLRCTSRALTAVDLIPECGATIVDEALRRRVSLDELWAAFAATPNRTGNGLRRCVLIDSRDRPWSAAERAAHRALRAAGVRGWRANHPVIESADDPPVAVLDIALVELKLAVEIDGAQYHNRLEAFGRDRWRDEQLALLGWQVVRFSARRVLEDPEGFARAVVEIASIRARQLGKP